jgi:hypothetical protein
MGCVAMLLLGLLIVAAAVAFAIVVSADNLGGGPHYSVKLFDHHLATVNTLGAFLAGIALTLVFCLGLLMMTAGARRERRRNSELRAARRERKAAAKANPGTVNGPVVATDTAADNAARTTADTGAGAGRQEGVEGYDGDTVESPVLTKHRSRTPHLFSH